MVDEHHPDVDVQGGTGFTVGPAAGQPADMAALRQQIASIRQNVRLLAAGTGGTPPTVVDVAKIMLYNTLLLERIAKAVGVAI